MSRPCADDALRRLDDLIARALLGLARPGLGPPEYLPPRVPITIDEAAGFFRSVDAGVFELNEDGTARPRLMRPSTAACYPLFTWWSKAQNKVNLWREWLTHAAAPAVLHFDLGYPLRDIALDVDAFDVLVYSRLNQPYVAVEVKKSAAEVESMLARMQSVERLVLGPGFRRLANYEQKYRGLLALRPPHFLALAPGCVRSFSVDYPDGTLDTARLTPVEHVPCAES